MLFDIVIILLLILVNGLFAMTELAVVSSRKARLQARAEAGSKGARAALELKEDPGKFLSTIQIGITLIGIFSGALGGVALARPLEDYIARAFPSFAHHADDIAITLVVTVITYLSLVVGELVPKQIALKFADSVAILIAPPIRMLSLVARPVVAVLDRSSMLMLTLLGLRHGDEQAVSEEDVKAAIAEGTESGVLEPEEKQILERVLRLDDIPVTAAMTHRKDIVSMDADEALESALLKVRASRHSRYPLYDKSPDNILGVVLVKDMLLQRGGGAPGLRHIVRKPIYFPGSKTVLEALEEFKQSTSNMALIVDEYGSLQGIVTLKDIMEAIVGTLPEPAYRHDFTATQREDGSWLVDGGLSIHETEEALGIKALAPEDGGYTTLAGFVLSHLGHVPKEGDSIGWNGWRFEVVDMDGHRIDKVLITRAA